MIAISAVDKSLSKPARPCTEYNIFFQLERAHVLQVRLGSEPRLDGLEAFRPSQPSYAGLPPLPERYASLVLPYDWHLPGKERRRRRKHRRTHGAIGFHELSNAIAAAWKEAGDDVRAFCARVSEVGAAKYKLAMKEWKRNEKKEQRGAAAIVEETAKAANRAAARAAVPAREPSEKEETAKTAAVGQEDDFDLDALLRDIQEDEAKHARPAIVSSDALGKNDEAHSIWTSEDERPLIEQFLSADPGVIGSVNPSSVDHSIEDGFGSSGLNEEVFTKDVFERSASIVSNEPVDMDDDEIIRMWNDGGEASAADDIQYCREIAPSHPFVAPVFGGFANFSEDADGCKSAFGLKGYDVTMEEVRRLKKILEGQARVMEREKRPATRHRRRSIVACCA